MRRSQVLPAVLLAAAFVAAPAPAHAQVDSLPYVTSITTIPAQPCDSIPTRIVVAGEFPTQCGAVLGNFGFTIYISDPIPPCAGCMAGPKPWADTLAAGTLPAGTYTVAIRLGVVGICAPGDTSRYETRYTFRVVSGCPPPNAFDPMTYVEHVRITPVRDPVTPIICENDSILLRVSGTFPDNCHILRSIQMVPNVAVSPGGVVPVSPTVRLVFDNLCCSTRDCSPFPTSWEGQLVLPPMPPGLRGLDLVGYEVCCRDIPNSTDPVGRRHYDFSVTSQESCGVVPPPITCLYPSWLHDQTGRCDAFLSKTGDPAVVTGTVHTTEPLAGIQGEVHARDDSGQWPLMVSAIEPIGPATGMHLTWEQIPGGAKFVLWADQGAPIPSDSGRRPSQFLKISWIGGVRNMRDPGIVPPDTHWYVTWNHVFGSDINGQLVPLCPIVTLAIDAAIICAGEPAACDLNGDSHSDVRDLVLMSHCLVSPRACPWDSVGLDCDGDADFDFDDLYCCARNVLGIPPCPNCGDSIRVDPDIAVNFGTPVRGANVIEVPVRIAGAFHLGAARLTLAMPPGLADLTTLEQPNSRWLNVTRAIGDRLEIGLIALMPSVIPEEPTTLEAVLRIPTGAGPEASGEIVLSGADLSGPDGVKLKADLGTPVVRLGPGLGVSLSQARPNPFATSTTFRITLDAATDAAEIGIYDLSGRRVTTLYTGPLPVGSHPFTWDGRVEGGGKAKAGVFFVRAIVGGHTTNQKLVMLKQ